MASFEIERPLIIKAWERKRIWYNLWLVFPTILGYGMIGEISAAVGDRTHLSRAEFLFILGCLILAANICYSLIYALEFWFWHPSGNSWWHRGGYKWAYRLGTFFAMILAVICGRQLGLLQYGFVVIR